MEGSINLVYQNMTTLAAKAGVPWEQFWAERVQATYIASVTSLYIQGVMVLIGILLAAFLLPYVIRADKASDGAINACVAMLIYAGILVLTLAFALPGAVMGLTNPEFQTIADVYAKAITFR